MRWQAAGDKRYGRAVTFLLVLVLHAGLLRLLQQGLIRLPSSAEAPLVLLRLAPHPPLATAQAPTKSRPSRPHPQAPPQDGPAILMPRFESAATPPFSIDWSAEAALAAQHQTELAATLPPRSLDDHHRHGSHQDGWGLNDKGPHRFGWYHAGTHRIDTSNGLPIINVNDRCIIVPLGLIPFPICKIGKIPARGDLFQHMHDAPADGASTPP